MIKSYCGRGSQSLRGNSLPHFLELDLVQHPPNRRRPDNAGSSKEGRFCETKRLVVVDGDGSLGHHMRLPSFQTRQCEESEAKCF